MDLMQKLSRFFHHNFLLNKDFFYIFQRNSSNVSSLHELGFTYINTFSMELHTFLYMSRFVPYISYSKISKNRDTLGNVSTSAFSIETLGNYT